MPDGKLKTVSISKPGVGVELTEVSIHQITLEDFETGFDLMKSGMCGKIIMTV